MPTLIYKPGQADEASYTIGAEPVIIGRADEHAVSIPDKSLSRAHARIEREGEALFVVDLASKNGTFVNGNRVTRQRLRQGDTLVLGDLAFVYSADDAADATAALHRGALPRAVRALTRVPIERLARDAAQPAPDRLRLLLEVAKLLSGREDLDVLLGKILDLAFQMLDVDRGAVLLVDERSGQLEARVTKSRRPAPAGEPTYSKRIVDYVLGNSVAAVFADAAADPRLSAAQSVLVQSIRASMCVPLKPRDDVIGVLYLDNLSAPHAFPEADLEFLVAFASLAAIAVENAALYRRIERETVERMALVMNAKVASLNGLVAGIAHEIRNPLNFVANFAELSSGLLHDLSQDLAAQSQRIPREALHDMEDALAALAENAARVNEHGRRADAIIQAMQLHARPFGGEREETEVNALVAESLKLALAARPAAAGMEPSFERDAGAGSAELSRGELSRALINVIDNALYALVERRRREGEGYTPRLTLRTADLGDRVEIRVRDNGPGITPEIADRIYDPFFTTRPPGEGTGLGLSLGHDIIVHGHQGSMRMDSVPGSHCEMVITLPRRGLSRRG